MAERKTRRTRRRTGSVEAGKGTGAANAIDPHAGIPAWLPPIAYAIVTALLFREVILEGALLLGTDTLALSYFARQFYTSFVTELGRFPLWNPLLFGGIPFVDGMHGDIFYPPSLALFFLDAQTMWGWKMLLHVYAAGIFAYLWLRSIGIGRGAAFFGGLVFMMGADLVSLVFPGGDGKLFVSSLAPLMFWLTERCARNRRLADFAAFSLGLALVVFTSHMQLAYFTVWGVSLYFFFRTWQIWRAERSGAAAAKLVGLFALAGVLGVGAATVQFLPPLQYLQDWSHRADKTVEETGYEYSATWSLHPEEAMALVVPEFVGDDVPTEVRPGDRYWGRNEFKINHEYAGLIPLLLLPLLFIGKREPRTWFFAALGMLSVLYALGATTPIFRLFYLIPGVSLFRAPSLIIFLYGLSIATLGAMAVQRLIDAQAERPDTTRTSRTRLALWIIAGTFLLLALAQSSGNIITSLWQSVFGTTPGRAPALQTNLAYIRSGFWIAFAFATSVAALWEAVSRGLLGVREAVLAFALLAAIDLYRVDRPFIRGTVLYSSSQAGGAIFQADDTIRFLQDRVAAGEVFRVFDLGSLGVGAGRAYGWNTLARHGIEQLTGHHGNEIGRYRHLMGDADSAPNVAVSNLRLMNLANVEYVVLTQRIADPGFEEVHLGRNSAVYRNLNALPRAWLAGSTEIVNDDVAVERLLSEDFDPRSTVLLREPLPAELEVQPDPQGTVSWAEREADHYTLNVTTDRPALLVITDNYYPAWKAEIDGNEAPILRANYTFRAIPVPAGTHQVRLYYDSSGLNNSAFASAALLLLLGGVAATGLRRRPMTGGAAGTGSLDRTGAA
ncbi:MAG TPA: YfhO family protein [Longimicrobiales bacterium]|nr:YfhO family protein [Longimicrobiales bacterium]